MDPTILKNTFWACEALIICLLLAPIWRFLTDGWAVRKQEFTNRLFGKPIGIYLDRFWADTLKKKLRSVTEPDEQFSKVYNIIAGRSLYVIPAIILLLTLFMFGGFAIQSGLRAGYEQYLSFYQDHKAAEKEAFPWTVTHSQLHDLDQAFLPFPLIVFSLSTLASVAGAYLYVSQIVIAGYQRRSLLSSDLLWCSFRLIIAIPLGMCVALPGANVGLPLVAFGLGAFPIGAINKLLRRLTNRSLNLSEEEDNKDDLLKLTGVTPELSAQLQAAGVGSPQQLANTDPVSLSLRTGMPFDFMLNLAAQGQVWCYLGATTAALAPLGFGDARAIATLMAGDPTAKTTCLAALAQAANIDLAILTLNFEMIAADPYTVFLKLI